MLAVMVEGPSRPRGVPALSRFEYDNLVDIGWIADQRIEFLRGTLVDVSPQRWPHAAAVEFLNEQLVLQIAGRPLKGLWDERRIAYPVIVRLKRRKAGNRATTNPPLIFRIPINGVTLIRLRVGVSQVERAGTIAEPVPWNL